MRYAKQITVISILLFLAVAIFSATAIDLETTVINLEATAVDLGSASSEEGSSQSQPTHHSHPTVMSLQGQVEGIADANLGVKVSEQNSCTQGVFFDHNYGGAIADNLFNLALGTQYDLNLNYNQDYYMCLYVDDELIDGPNIFRGGQGQIDIEDVNTSGFATEFVPYSGAGSNIDLGDNNLTAGAFVCFDADCNAMMYYESETGDLVIDVVE
jgi:hypothetical protein